MYICILLPVEFLETVAFEMSWTECLCRHPQLHVLPRCLRHILPGSRELCASVLEWLLPHVPAWWNSLSSSTGVCSSREKEAAIFRAAVSLKLLLFGVFMWWNKCSLVDDCWRLMGSWSLWWCAEGCSCSQNAAHHRLLCCAGGGRPGPGPWASVS